MRCADCKYYDRRKSLCNKANWGERSMKVSEKTFSYFADATDDSGLYAGIIVGKDFGCVLFEEKKQPLMPTHL